MGTLFKAMQGSRASNIAHGPHCNTVCDIVQRLVAVEGALATEQLHLLRGFVAALPSGMRTKALQKKLQALVAKHTAAQEVATRS